MAFPQDALPIRGEMLINNVWTNVTTRIRNESDIVITGGLAPEQTSITPCTCAFTLNNRDGLFSDDNPTSAYYGLLPTGTPFRASIVETTPFLRLPNGLLGDPLTLTTTDWSIAWAQTTDKAVLDVVGDLDLRIEVEPDQWQLGSCGQQLAGKYTTASNQRSWAWVIQPSGVMRLYWSADGLTPVSAGTYADSTAIVPGTARIALRVTIDVNNGAAGRTITFYTSDSITGTWVQLGSAVVQSTVTSIFSGSGIVTAGAIGSTTGTIAIVSDGTFGYTLPLAGRIYRFQMYSGIGGTLVADMNATVQTEGATSWSDGLGTPNTWTLVKTAEITKADYRSYGEIAEMPQEWDSSGTDFYVRTVASGIVRRLTQGAQALNSPIYRNLQQYIGAGALGYWPLEGGSQSTAAGNVVAGQPAARVTSVQFSTDNEFPASAGVMTLTDSGSGIVGSLRGTAPADQGQIIFYHKVDSAPASDINVVHFYTSGTARQITFIIGSGTYRVKAFDATGTELGTSFTSFGTGASPGQWLATQMKITKNGAGVDIDLAWYPLGTTTAFYGVATLNLAAATVGAVTGFATSSSVASAGLNATFAHFMLLNLAGFEFANATFAQTSIAFRGELAALRWLRILREEGVQGRVVGWPADSIAMGPQPIDTLTGILDDCVSTAGALQYEARDMAALVLRTQRSLLAQEPVTLTYPRPTSHLSGSFSPTFDDQNLRNDVTAQSAGGAFARASKETGPRSAATPPLGAGRYASFVNVNPYDDDDLADLAGYAVYLGTWNARRVPNLEVWLQRSAFVANATLTRSLRSVNPGDRVLVSSVPIQVGGGDADTLIRGYRETLQNRGHMLAFSTVPYGPYLAANDLTLGSNTRYRAAAVEGGSLVAADITSGALSVAVDTHEGKLWGSTVTKPGNFPLSILIAGEKITVSGIAAWVLDDFARTSSNSWGTPTTGPSAWITTGGAASDYSVSAGVGRQNLSTVTTERVSELALAGRVSQVRLTSIQQVTALTGVGGTCTMVVHLGTATNYVRLNIMTTTAGSSTHWVNQVVNSVETAFDSAFPSTGLTTTAAMAVLVDVSPTLVRAKVWAASLNEPSAWTTSVALTAPNVAGSVFLRSLRNASSTNASPFNIEYDNLTLPRTQLFTLSARAVNSVTKAQTANTAVQVAEPFYVART